MKVEYDRDACAGWFQCVQKWNKFEMNMGAGKADLEGGEDQGAGIVVRAVPEDQEADAIAAAESCPVDAIVVLDADGNQIAPEDD